MYTELNFDNVFRNLSEGVGKTLTCKMVSTALGDGCKNEGIIDNYKIDLIDNNIIIYDVDKPHVNTYWIPKNKNLRSILQVDLKDTRIITFTYTGLNISISLKK